MTNNIPFHLLDKYLAGTCNADELETVQSWYASYEDDDDLISSLPKEEQQLLEKFMYRMVLSRIGMQTAAEQPRFDWRKIAVGWLSAAASILVLYFVFFYQQNTTKKSAIRSQPDKLVSIVNHSGKLQQHIFPDGSIVWLSPGSSVNYSALFGIKDRQVNMRGDCYYEIARHEGLPFTIYSTHLITKVLGTSFSIRDGEKLAKAAVDVKSGSVVVSKREKGEKPEAVSNEQRLSARQRAIYDEHDRHLTVQSIPQNAGSEMVKWERRTILFDNEQLESVAAKLNTLFGVSIVLTDPALKTYRLHADFSDFNLAEILDVIGKSLQVNYHIQDNHITLTPIR